MAQAVSELPSLETPSDKDHEIDKKELQRRIKDQLSAYEHKFVEMSKNILDMVNYRDSDISHVLDSTMIYLEKNSLERSLLDMISAAVSAGMKIKKDLIWYKPSRFKFRKKWAGFSMRTVLRAKYWAVSSMVDTLIDFKENASREIEIIKAEISNEIQQGKILEKDISALEGSKDLKKKIEKSSKILEECDKLLGKILKKCESVSGEIKVKHLKKMRKHVTWQFKMARKLRGGFMRKNRVKRIIKSWKKENKEFTKYLKSLNKLIKHFKEEVEMEKKLSEKQKEFLEEIGFQDYDNEYSIKKSFETIEDREKRYQKLIKKIRKMEKRIRKSHPHVEGSEKGEEVSGEIGKMRDELSHEEEEVEQMIDLIGILMRFETLLYNTETKHLVVEEGIITMVKWIDNVFETIKKAIKESKPIGGVVSKMRETVDKVLDKQIRELMKVAEIIEHELGEEGSEDVPGASKIVHEIAKVSKKMEETIDKLSTNSKIMTDIKDKLRKSAKEQKKRIDEEIKKLEKSKKEAEKEAKKEEKDMKKASKGSAREKLGGAFSRFKKMARFDRSEVISETDEQINSLKEQKNQVDPPISQVISKINELNFGIQDIRAFSSIMEHIDIGKKVGEMYKGSIEHVEERYNQFEDSLSEFQIQESIGLYASFLTLMKRSLEDQMTLEKKIISMFKEFEKAQVSLQNFLNNTSETPAKLSEISSMIGSIGFIGDEVAEAVRSAIEETNQVATDMQKLANYSTANMDSIRSITGWFNAEASPAVKRIIQEIDKSIKSARRTESISERFTAMIPSVRK